MTEAGILWAMFGMPLIWSILFVVGVERVGEGKKILPSLPKVPDEPKQVVKLKRKVFVYRGCEYERFIKVQ